MAILQRIKNKLISMRSQLWLKRRSAYIDSTCRIFSIPQIVEIENLKVGPYCSFNQDVFIHCAGGVAIGRGCVLSRGVSVISQTLDPDKYFSGIYVHTPKRIEIGHHVWLCSNVMVLPGVKIANNVIVAAGSVVTHDCLEEYCVYAGSPARVVKRFHKE